TKLVLQTPDPIINTLFYFSKIRASESIFNSSMGLVHSPGGGNYYVGIWANDQVEYSGPFFPYLGYETGNMAAFNAYQMFQKNIPEGDDHIAYAFEVDGNFPMEHLDRGDAAMISYGLSHYLLAKGDFVEAKLLWPLLEWSLNYCHTHRNDAGAVLSESDEMEGRIATGDANLSTTALYYGGLKYSQRLAKSLGRYTQAEVYGTRKMAMKSVIEDYFGHTMKGLKTYKYFKENQFLRHWICLPLSVGITERKAGTLDALFNHLWTDNGILVELKDDEMDKNTTFWDRATLYALQGAMKVGGGSLAAEKWKQFSEKRLLGDHVPYVVEAYPENNMKHLSAESALYCRIVTEGLLGIEPISLKSIRLSPTLPQGWDFLTMDNLALGGQKTSINLKRIGDKLNLEVKVNNESVFKELIQPKEQIEITLQKE
ncbi:MAG: six-hairpin glycosidase-like protein, partial [Bacteroidota bacterium]